MEDSAKPADTPCPWCDGAAWNWNGFEWYPADIATRKLHVCAAPEAVADRAAREARANRSGLGRAFGRLFG